MKTMTKDSPLISILICNYNNGGFIKETLQSAANQSYKNIEIVIIDDGSKDGSVKVINQFVRSNPDKKFNLKLKKQNKGVCFARNDAIAIAQGEYFVFLDSDDTMPVDYISSLYETSKKTKADIVYADVRHFGAMTGISRQPEYDANKLLIRNYIAISALVKKSTIGNSVFDVKLNRKSHEDYDFWLGLSLKGLSFVKAKDIYLNYRIHDQSRNRNTKDMVDQSTHFIDIWEYMIKKYSKRHNISEDVFLTQIRAQVNLLGGELVRLNKVIQNELKPELEKREVHIMHQRKAVESYESLRAEHESLLASRDYMIGNWIMSKARKIKRIFTT